MIDSYRIILYADGACLGNPGRAGIGFILYTSKLKLIKKTGKFIGTTTNNTAEYLALIYGMQEALNIGAGELICYTDSQLVVNQLKGKYKVRSQSLLLFYNQVKHLESLFEKASVHYVSRDSNVEADRLAKRAAKEMREWVTTGELSPEESPGTGSDTG